MVATKVLISLCIVASTVAAASTRPRSGRQFNQEAQIVTSVVSSLTPEIETAVANALAGLRAQQEAEARAQLEAQLRAQQAAQAAAAAEAQRRAEEEAAARAAAAAAAAADAANANNAPAQYSYEYQVRDDESETYIFKNENREGDEVTGVYGYVNPEGTLVTVNYRAGPDGFYQTVENEANFLRSGSSSGGVRQTTAAVAPVRVPAPAPAPRIDESALIAQIVATLQPTIASSVNSVLASQQQQQQVVSRSVVAAPVGQAGDRLVPLFGFNQA